MSADRPAPVVVPLWPEGVPGLRPDATEERVVDIRVMGVHVPTLVVHPAPAAAACGTAVIFCPGGGYEWLTIGPDGGEETRFLNELGVTVFILHNRLKEYGHPAPLRDALRAVRLVRSRAADLGVDPGRIGVLGESAGGHLAACAATLWDAPEGRTGAAIDGVSARPDFSVLIYPVITLESPFAHEGSRRALLGENASPDLVRALSLERRVRPDMPPVFIAAALPDEAVPVENSLHFYQALRTAGVRAELHCYALGSHGNSLDPAYGPVAQWPRRVEDWMRFNGWLAPGAAEARA